MQQKHSTRRDNFVAPDPPALRVEKSSDLPNPPITLPMPYSNHTDRARGFTLATAPLAGVAGFVAALVGILGFQVPLASLVTLLIALGGFAGVWLIAYVAHTLITPDGALMAHVLFTWGYLRREQKERHRRYGKS